MIFSSLYSFGCVSRKKCAFLYAFFFSEKFVFKQHCTTDGLYAFYLHLLKFLSFVFVGFWTTKKNRMGDE